MTVRNQSELIKSHYTAHNFQPFESQMQLETIEEMHSSASKKTKSTYEKYDMASLSNSQLIETNSNNKIVD